MPRRAQGPSYAPGVRAPGLRVGTHNVRGLLADNGLKLTQLVRQWAGRLRLHIVCVQETKLRESQAARAQTQLRLAAAQLQLPAYRAFWAHAREGDGGGGVGILIREDLLASGQLVVSGPTAVDGRALRVQLQWGGHRLSLCTAYLQSGDFAAQREFIQAKLRPLLVPGPALAEPVLCGDFNFTDNWRLDRRRLGRAAGDRADRASSRRNEERTATAMAGMCADAQMSDAFRLLHPRRREFTFWSTQHSQSRLDRVYVGAALRRHVESCRARGTAAPSDHRPVVLHLRPARPATRGRGLPRLRLGALSSVEGKAALRAAVAALSQGAPVTDPHALIAWWAPFKRRLVATVRALAREWAARLVAPGPARAAAAAELAEAEAALGLARGRVAVEAAVQRATRAQRAWAATMRAEALPAHRAAQIQWLQAGERPSPLISKLTSRPESASGIAALRAPRGGGLVTHGPTLAQLAVEHFAAVSAAPRTTPTARAAVLAAVARHAKRLDPAAAEAAGAPEVQLAEVLAAIKRARPGTSPGPDGIPVELWRWCSAELAPLLAAVFSAIGATGQRPRGFPDGAVSPLPKDPELDPTLLPHFRPITLLNTDYRLLTKCLATRWGKVLGPAVGREQTAFLPGRRIGETVMLLQLLPAALRAQGKSGAIAFLDFQKAYDTVDREFLLGVMSTVGAGGGMRSWAATLLADTRAVAVVNGHVSAPRTWHAGVRQGCPLAPAMYLFVAWALSCWLQDTASVGVQLGAQHVPCAQYADDCNVLLSGCKEEHVAPLVAALDTFGDASGQRLNRGKSKLLPIGALPVGQALPAAVCGLPIVTSAVTLGIAFANDDDAARAAMDWAARVDGVLACYKKLACLPLSMFGRAFAASGYGVSQLLYHAEFSDPPATALARLQQATVKLVDKGLAPHASPLRPGHRLPGVPSGLLPGRPSEGGVGMMAWGPHITARRAVWARRLLEELATPAQAPPWVLAAAVVLQATAPGVQPAFAFLEACAAGPATLPCATLRRLARGLLALGPPRVCVPAQLASAGPACAALPLWHLPQLRLDLPLSQWPAHCQARVAELAAALLVPALDADRRGAPSGDLHAAYDALRRWSARGFAELAGLPSLRTLGDLCALHTRLTQPPPVGQRPPGGWSARRMPEFLAAVSPGTGMLALPFETQAVAQSPHALVEAVTAMWQHVPPELQRAAAVALPVPLPGTGVALALRGLLWIPRLAAARARAARAARAVGAVVVAAAPARGGEAPPAPPPPPPPAREWRPAEFDGRGGLQLFSDSFSVRAATAAQRGPQEAARAAAHRATATAALALGAPARVQLVLRVDQETGHVGATVLVGPPPQLPDPGRVQRALAGLPSRLRHAWSLPVDNHWKATWWRLLLGGVPGAGGHGVVLRKKPCPCGWHVPMPLVGAAAAAAQRDHVMWECEPARAVRRLLAAQLPAGTVLRPHHLWLLQPPVAAVHPGPWAVACMVALTAIDGARRFMWRIRCRRQEEGPRQRTLDEVWGLALAPPAPAALDLLDLPEDAESALEPAPAVGPAAPARVRASRFGARRAVAVTVAGLQQFVDMGVVPASWVGGVGADHAFLGVRSEPGGDVLVSNLRVPAVL
jgi:exonuclease III